MKLSQIEKRIPQTLTNSKNIIQTDREYARRSSRARSTRGQENEAWALYKKIPSWGSWGDLSTDRYIICPKPPSPTGKILDRRQLFHSVGPKEDPWGHPRFITFQSLVALPTFTLLSRSMVIITSWFAIAARSRVLARLVVSLAQIGELARRLNQQQSKRRLEHSFRIVKQLPFHFASEILKKCLNIPKHFLNISKNPLHISK